jgi:hypothetical protein
VLASVICDLLLARPRDSCCTKGDDIARSLLQATDAVKELGKTEIARDERVRVFKLSASLLSRPMLRVRF